MTTTTTTLKLDNATRYALLIAFVSEADESNWGVDYTLRGVRALVNVPESFEVLSDLDLGDVNENACSDEVFVVLTADYQGVSLR